MTSRWCTGTIKPADNNTDRLDLNRVRAYEEGVQARLASSTPVNPHTVDTPESNSWIQGAADAAAGTIKECSSYRGQTGPV